jgi:hypothetical protein
MILQANLIAKFKLRITDGNLSCPEIALHFFELSESSKLSESLQGQSTDSAFSSKK